jgi:hypothetical protein
MEMIQHLGKIARIDCSDDIRLEVIKDRAIRITVVNTVKYYPVKRISCNPLCNKYNNNYKNYPSK